MFVAAVALLKGEQRLAEPPGPGVIRVRINRASAFELEHQRAHQELMLHVHKVKISPLGTRALCHIVVQALARANAERSK